MTTANLCTALSGQGPCPLRLEEGLPSAAACSCFQPIDGSQCANLGTHTGTSINVKAAVTTQVNLQTCSGTTIRYGREETQRCSHTCKRCILEKFGSSNPPADELLPTNAKTSSLTLPRSKLEKSFFLFFLPLSRALLR